MGQKTEQIFERAKVNIEEKNHENALRLLNEVLNREPRHKKALRNKALIKLLNAPPEEVEEFLLFAIDQQPQDDQLYQMLGTFYQNNDHPKKALAQLKKAAEINDANKQVHQALGILYANIYGEHEKAVTHFSKMIELGSEKADVYFSRGCSYMVLEKMTKAEKDLQQAQKLGHAKAGKMITKYFG